MSYICNCCGKTHQGLPDLTFDQPAFARDVPDEERKNRVRLNSDLCVVDDQYYFIRAVIEIPIQGTDEMFGIGAWVSQKGENFRTYVQHFDSSEIGPFFGWLSNEFVFHGERTLNLKTMVHFRGRHLRPRIELEATDHPLAAAHRNGISLDDAWAFIHSVRGDAAKYP